MFSDTRLLLQNVIEESLKLFEGSIPCPQVLIDVPADKQHGEFSCNIALQLSRLLKKSPLLIAQQILPRLQELLNASSINKQISKIEIKAPGFINFYLSDEGFYNVLYDVFQQKENFGRSHFGKAQKFCLEFVSANPTGPLTVAHGRQAAVGDSLVNILQAVGFNAQREYYVNDEGNQINILGRSIKVRAQQILGQDLPFPEDGYQGDYIRTMAQLFMDQHHIKTPSDLDQQPDEAYRKFGVVFLMDMIKKDLEDFGVHFDIWSYQSTIADPKAIEQVLVDLRSKGFIYDSEGAWWFKSTLWGDDKDRVVRKSDGQYTYLTPDMVYHKDKFARGFERIVNILGPDHHGYIPRIKAAAGALGHSVNDLDILIVQLATIYRDGKEVSMSTRRGEFISLREVMNEVGRDAARFFFLMRQASAHLEFDLELAKKQSSENPVYYIQYAHARIYSIIGKAHDEFHWSPKTQDLKYLKQPEEIDLMRKIGLYPDMLIGCAKALEPFGLVRYLQEVAATFHKFYDSCRVLDENKELSIERLALIEAARIVLGEWFKATGSICPSENVIKMTKQWNIQPQDPQLQKSLSDELAIHPIIAQLLINRQIVSAEQARMFLSADMSSLYNPFLLTDMDRAVARIDQARKKSEKILIYGDYDVDGVTSSALLRRLLNHLGIKAINYIPHRMEEGYGLNQEVAEFAKSQGIHLLITVDCGINAFAPIEAINAAGIDVIVIDHHEPEGMKLPPALAVIDPKRPDCLYPFKNLSAVGLVAKLMQAILGHIPLEDLDLVALGTVADVVPLRGENRIFVKNGLPFIERTNKPGLKALLEVAKIAGKKMKPYYIGFILGPRLNAAGRMDSAAVSLDLLLSENPADAYALACSLEAHNLTRQKMQGEVVEEALRMIEGDEILKAQDIIVVYKEGWHKGVLGIVASRIVDKYYRPTVVISVEDGIGTGSARSIDGFHLHEALTSCAGVLENYGGHKRAAGLRLKHDNIEIFRQAINDFAQQAMPQEKFVPTMEIDCEIPLSVIDLSLMELIGAMEPHGEGNPTPVFCSRSLTVKSQPSLLGKDTIKFWVSDGVKTISAVGFGMGSFKDKIKLGCQVDLAYTLSIDDWNKAPAVQLMLKDIR